MRRLRHPKHCAQRTGNIFLRENWFSENDKIQSIWKGALLILGYWSITWHSDYVVSKRRLEHFQSILMKDCVIRGDLANVRIGKFCIIQSGTIIRPPYKHFSKGLTFFPVHVGDYVMIEEVNKEKYKIF